MYSKKNTFQDFLDYFEVISPPIIISEETINHIKDVTKPLSQDLLVEYVSRWEGEIDEYTEITPCFALPYSDEYKALVYWKAGLLRYEYIIITLDKSDTLIARKTICGTIVEGEIIKKSVAKIDEDLIIHIQAGATYQNQDFDPSLSQSYSIEILASGDMIFQIDE